MNLSRAYSLAYGGELFRGPRADAHARHGGGARTRHPQFRPGRLPGSGRDIPPHRRRRADSQYDGTWFRDKDSPQQSMRLPPDGEEAGRIAARARTGQAAIESVDAQTQRMPPPLFYDLTELQRHANRLFGFSAQKTLDIAQALYERHKLISYPRTDSRHLSQDVAQTLPRIVKTIEAPYREHLAPGTGERPLSRRFVDDSKVTDHHAIIPTTTSPATRVALARRAQNLRPHLPPPPHRLARRSRLVGHHRDHRHPQRRADRPLPLHRQRRAAGRLESARPRARPRVRRTRAKRSNPCRPASHRDKRRTCSTCEALKKKTRPPKRFTEATLLTAMETAGKTLDEKELSDAMKESGLGTPATRAAIIEVLLKREYIVRNGKSLEATDKGIRLIEVVHPEVKSPAMTGQWEAYLKRIQRGTAQLDPFLEGHRGLCAGGGRQGGQVGGAAQRRGNGTDEPAHAARLAVLRRCTEPRPVAATPSRLGSPQICCTRLSAFPSFRANQEAVCHAVIDGQRRAAGHAHRLGQVALLPVARHRARRHHAGHQPADRADGRPGRQAQSDADSRWSASTPAATAPLRGRSASTISNGQLQFLFIAPERLRVAGFPEMLAKRKPSLIAIDEAHCISQWGHDFRPDYRMLGQYLPTLRPAPVIALTATATPLVQDDIAEQLGLGQRGALHPRLPARQPRDRSGRDRAVAPRRADAASCLQDEDRRPAIVYAPTAQAGRSARRRTQRSISPPRAYHAGLDAERRKRVQEQFLEGRARSDGRDHRLRHGHRQARHPHGDSHRAARQRGGLLPGDRARRPRWAAQPAILMHSYADRHTHDFFFERDYPDVRFLDEIFASSRRRAHCEKRRWSAGSRHEIGGVREGAGEALDPRRRH